MAITKLPPAPTPTDTTNEFNAKSFAFVAALDGFVTETNALEVVSATSAKSAAEDALKASTASIAAVNAAKTAVADAATATAKAASVVSAAKSSGADAEKASKAAITAVNAAKTAAADASAASIASKAAVSSAKSTAVDAATASVASSSVISATNFKGEWSLLSGALAVPSTVSHLNKVWILTQGTPNVKTEVPGVSGKWLSTSDLSSPGPIGKLTPDAGFFKTIHVIGSPKDLSVKLPNIKEMASIRSIGAAGTIDFDLTSQSVIYAAPNATGNWTINFRGSGSASLDSLMATGEVISATFIATQGASAFLNNVVKVDGRPITPKWIGGAPTSGNVNGLDSYSFALIKHGEANFTILASLTQFK